jgi:carbonic anhydrase
VDEQMSVTRFLEQNRTWVTERTRQDPDYFRREADRHQPACLFVGCSDARVPANVITGTEIGELFVHRNVANQVVATDPNLLAVVQYAVEVLRVTDIVVCGHEGCGGIHAALGPRMPAHVESWLAHVRAVARLHAAQLAALANEADRRRLLVELNVREQVRNLGLLPPVQDAWRAGRELRVHGWVYSLTDGLLRDLDIAFDGTEIPLPQGRTPAGVIDLAVPAA